MCQTGPQTGSQKLTSHYSYCRPLAGGLSNPYTMQCGQDLAPVTHSYSNQLNDCQRRFGMAGGRQANILVWLRQTICGPIWDRL